MKISDQDLERLVHGDDPESQELARLAEALQTWQADLTRTPGEEQTAAFAAKAAEIARQTKPEAVPQTGSAPSRTWRQTLKYKLAGGMAAVLMLSGMTGVAVASDDAAPGDALYALDRALESVGINDGGPTERITEAQALFDAGLTAEAVEHAAEAFEEPTEAVDALMAAADRVRMNAENNENNETADETLRSVGAMLHEMANTVDRGPEFGQRVSEMARGISTFSPEGVRTPSDLPDQSNGNPQENNSQNSGEQGRGNQGDQGNQGPPDSPPSQSRGGRP